MNTHPSRILNLELYNLYLNLCVANIKAARQHGNAAIKELWVDRLTSIIQFMAAFRYHIDGGDTAGNSFYWTHF